jgi:hypothetical protein
MNTNLNSKIPSVGQTHSEDENLFYFEVADNILFEKDKKISQLQKELNELKEFILEQRQEKINRDTLICSLTNVVEDIVALFSPDDKHKGTMATVRGCETVNNIVKFIDNFKNSKKILRLLETELRSVTYEKAFYKMRQGQQGGSPQIMCTTKSSIIGFDCLVINNISDNPFRVLKSCMEAIILETIKFCKNKIPNEVWYADDNANDYIHYKSNDEHFQIWEHKKIFSKRLVDATLVYIRNLIK